MEFTELFERRKACVGYLSNYEVLDILQGARSNRQHRKPHNQLATITYQTIRYLEDTPCKKQTPATISSFLKAVEALKLTKCEKLMLLNLCPSTALEIQLVIEDSEERLTEDEVSSLLQVIASHLTNDDIDIPEAGDQE
ncbi:DNA-directed RNA polymerase III subunit RPC9 isoform X2 [Athalia rosae]|uniref:DNA-directed RNA polymerase III subunit RPC9 isoform X2 n=1 Tax=Athalia rosae TaxID=37344 RepID=UPI002033E86F|nr:DNA-directed RNA polymerase III subunit RPC9 isoform X2 [Athalia rosae]